MKLQGNLFIVDWKMLPIKLHFLFYAVAISSVTAYLPTLCVSLGLSKTASGIIFTVSPFATVFTNPLFGWITDKMRKITVVILGMILIQIPFLIGNVFVPPLNTEARQVHAEFRCSFSSYALVHPNITTLLPESRELSCSLKCFPCLGLADLELCEENVQLQTQGNSNATKDFLKVTNMSVRGKRLTMECVDADSNGCEASCTFNVDSNQCVYVSYQFWTLFTLIVTSNIFTSAIMSIGDAACFEALEGKTNHFGKQKVWLTIGWGFGTVAAGYLLHTTVSPDSGKADYRYSAYFMLIAIVFDIIALTTTKLHKPRAPKHVFKNVLKIFTRLHPFLFTAAALVVGFSAGVQKTFQFPYLEQMGASKFLLGLSDGVLCIVVEAPFMFVSCWFVKRIGRDNCAVVALLSFSIWFLAASFINSPWWILLINVSEGPGLGLFGVAMSSYGKAASTPGTEATMQTLLGAILFGLGMGSGSLVGGIAYDAFGGRKTFFYTGLLAAGAACAYKFSTFLVAEEPTATEKPKGGVEAAVNGGAAREGAQNTNAVNSQNSAQDHHT